METIGINDYYDVRINLEKNRLYLTGKGFWSKIEIGQTFLDAVRQGIGKLSAGYSVLADLREFKTPPSQVAEIIIEAQKVTADTFGKNAQVFGENAAVAMALGRYARTSGLQSNTQSFETPEEAEAWLDKE